MFLVVRLSLQFENASALTEAPILRVTGFLLSAAMVHFAAVAMIPRTHAVRWIFAWIFAVGMLMRIGMFWSSPILEDDHFRYRWEGALVASGLNPATISPQSIINTPERVPAAAVLLAKESEGLINKVGYPDLATCYPPGATALFAMAYLLSPWSLTSWRGLLIAFDLASLLLLLGLLRRVDRSPLYIAVYWWSPLVIKEGFNAAHVDIALTPFVLIALILVMQPSRASAQIGAAMALAAASTIKLWPLALAPVLFLPLIKRPRLILATAFAGGLVLALPLWAFLPAFTGGESAGLLAYGREWQMNDALFMLLLWLAEKLPWSSPELVARGISAALFVLFALGIARPHTPTPAVLAGRVLAVVAMLFMLSPAQFPWYYLWVMPLLPLYPSRGLLLLSGILFLYNLRFYLKEVGHVEIFDQYLVWLEYLPAWFLLLFDGIRGYERTARKSSCETD
ncbi:DUF2029 domain-containing protein [bacterium]|nr:DUF2029 domain-containing protein [bacterium]